ncbi:phosphotransferase [Candidatus Poribacteria bacterium]|nr:phosphotransferase [Candidatus Poribacteria bacterium]
MKNTSTYRKVCRTPEQAAKERAILRVLQASPLQHLSPQLTEVRPDPLVVEMAYMSGKAPTPDQFGNRVLEQLGEVLRRLHYLRPCTTFGSFDAALDVPLGYTTFGDFLEMQIRKWSEWHAPMPGSYLPSYVSWLWRGYDALREYFRSVDPLFCHGDVDSKNLVIQEGVLTGLFDWEHAGDYCLAWELRKLPRVLGHDWQWYQLLSAYSGPDRLDQRALRTAIHYLNAVDLLGHLRWCRRRNLLCEEGETLHRMHALLNLREVN